MLKEIGLATGLLGNVLDMFKADKKDKTDEVSGTEEFGALMAGGITISDLPTATKADEAEGVTGVGLTDGVDAGVQEALDLLREMTSGGLEGAMRWAMKELREDVMDGMNISEQELAALPADQKAAVEKAIADEVQKRLAEAMNKDKQELAAGGNALAPQDIVAGLQKALQAEATKAYKEEVPTV